MAAKKRTTRSSTKNKPGSAAKATPRKASKPNGTPVRPSAAAKEKPKAAAKAKPKARTNAAAKPKAPKGGPTQRRIEAFDRTFPEPLQALNRLDYDYAEGEGIDFEAYEQFQPAEDNADWFPLWTGNKDLDGSEYRVFGQDGTGGYAAFWMIRPGKEVLEQPIVFFGSEGEVGVVARDFTDYVWLLAGGVGPMEAVEGRTSGRQATTHLAAFAERHAPRQRKSVDEVLARAKAEFPKFEASIRALCK